MINLSKALIKEAIEEELRENGAAISEEEKETIIANFPELAEKYLTNFKSSSRITAISNHGIADFSREELLSEADNNSTISNRYKKAFTKSVVFAKLRNLI